MAEASSKESPRRPVRRALVSVFDKSGVAELGRALADAGVEVVSTGSTAAVLRAASVPVTEVEDVTGFPECLDGRVKTLHPGVHAGILADRRNSEHVAQLSELGIRPFDLVVVNLYPFEDTVASGAGYEECIEKIDIGGPAMIRAAAKNHASVAVVVDPAEYENVAAQVRAGGFTDEERARLAGAAFRHTADYDEAVASWFSGREILQPRYEFAHALRYGENPHQRAAVYRIAGREPSGIAGARQLHGKEMSYNNFQDADAAWRAAFNHAEPCVAVVKHANPCGIAIARESVAEAHAKAHACDPMSAYGGVIACNREVTREMAEQVASVFTEVLVASAVSEEALEILGRKKNLRILIATPPAVTVEHRQISGGLLVQQRDLIDGPGDDPSRWRLVAGEPAGDDALRDLEFAWRAVRDVKSNAVLIAHDGATVGVGMGQVNRVDSARLAVERANTLGEGNRTEGAVAASDAFFPFADGLRVLAGAGVRAVVQPGGSIRDGEVIQAAVDAGITMYFTGTRHFAH